MSVISYSHDADLGPQYRNPNCTNLQEVEEELPPFSQNFHSPLYYENQLVFGTRAADHTQETNYSGLIWNEPLPRVNIINMNTAQEISTNISSSAGTHTHIHAEPSDLYSSKMKKSTFNKGSAARKSGKKDRHTKINTAQGVRDRRMRLSLQISRQFFDIQDMLGFDKASKTIDWLFSKSKKAIKQLKLNTNTNNICQNGSRGGEKSEQKRTVNITASEGERVVGVKTAENSVTSGNTKYNAKELRAKARARARERTRQKMMIRCLEKSNYNFSCGEAYKLDQLGPAEYPNRLFEIEQEPMRNSSSEDNIWTFQSSLQRQLSNMALLGATASSSGSLSCSMYNYDEKNGDFITGELDSFSNKLCYTGNWDIISEYSNLNSTSFHENRGYQYLQYSGHNQVE